MRECEAAAGTEQLAKLRIYQRGKRLLPLSHLSLERALRIGLREAMPPRRRPWPTLQIDVGGEGGGGFAGVVERKEEAKNVAADESSANRACASTTTATTKSIRASYAEAARRSTNNTSVSASAMLSFCDDGRLKPSAFGAAIRAGREGCAAATMRPSEFSVSAVSATEGAGGGGAAAAGVAGAAAPAAPQQQQQEKPSTSARVVVGKTNDGARR